MDTPTVVCLKKKMDGTIIQGCDIYIGRRFTMAGWDLPESKWANPFKVGRDGNLDQVIDKYRNYILSRPNLIAELNELSGKTLGCWCKGKKGREKCHGDALVEFFECSKGRNVLSIEVCGGCKKKYISNDECGYCYICENWFCIHCSEECFTDYGDDPSEDGLSPECNYCRRANIKGAKR